MEYNNIICFFVEVVLEGEEKETLANLHPRIVNKEMLCFMNLLETTKPYLMNVLRVPAGHACILFAKSSSYL